MKIMINQKEVSQERIEQWRKQRILKAAKMLNLQLPNTDKTEILDQALLEAKMKLTYEELIQKIGTKLKWSQCLMKWVAKWSKKPRKRAVVTIYASGLTATSFSKRLEKLMLENTDAHKRANLGACPDHYALQSRGSILEVIETAGNSPLPTQFFLDLGGEAEIEEPRDASYPFQSVGVARLANDCNVGGIRHQFRDTEKGLEARFCVEFPSLCPDSLIKEHQLHLAAEWSRWIAWCREHKE
ncbi:hypothetical protein [Streptococcus gordonii]|uniref:hypothetical protein n=1 Tax=Streptococcus gordonii TaxID=1302 RepID=UPI00073BCF54|nr:hypothetical protein [Streptococcus gordonii]KTF20708.1 hypothetical protein AT460_06085 [Streptococcus gordonii]KXC02939.1 hypothetical protein AWH02_06545 [Streptococcus gordonii]MBZ2150207.1 hypothetical protein [Streptococcus gordonii]QWZ58104.1 hypothetical protein I6L84_02390 [Streptococcus gordonii]SQF29471.1 Uncharacterised protein [Streptococcus gordonii]